MLRDMVIFFLQNCLLLHCCIAILQDYGYMAMSSELSLLLKEEHQSRLAASVISGTYLLIPKLLILLLIVLSVIPSFCAASF